MHRREFVAALAGGGAVAVAGCSDTNENAEAEIVGETLTLTTTTSTYDTGLVDEVDAAFEDRYGVTVEAVSQGTGAALESARRGDSDVVLVHARSLEDEFLREGYGVSWRELKRDIYKTARRTRRGIVVVSIVVEVRHHSSRFSGKSPNFDRKRTRRGSTAWTR